MLTIGNALNRACKRTAGAQNSLKFQAGYDVGILSIAQFWPDIAIHGFESWGKKHGADFQFRYLIAIIMIDRTCATGIHALITFGADAAFETPLGRFDHFLFAERGFHFAEVVLALVALRLLGSKRDAGEVISTAVLSVQKSRWLQAVSRSQVPQEATRLFSLRSGTP